MHPRRIKELNVIVWSVFLNLQNNRTRMNTFALKFSMNSGNIYNCTDSQREQRVTMSKVDPNRPPTESSVTDPSFRTLVSCLSLPSLGFIFVCPLWKNGLSLWIQTSHCHHPVHPPSPVSLISSFLASLPWKNPIFTQTLPTTSWEDCGLTRFNTWFDLRLLTNSAGSCYLCLPPLLHIIPPRILCFFVTPP